MSANELRATTDPEVRLRLNAERKEPAFVRLPEGEQKLTRIFPNEFKAGDLSRFAGRYWSDEAQTEILVTYVSGRSFLARSEWSGHPNESGRSSGVRNGSRACPIRAFGRWRSKGLGSGRCQKSWAGVPEGAVKQRLGLIVLAVLCISPLDSSTKAKGIHQLMVAYEKSRDFSGAVLVADRKGVVYRGGFGFANREAGTRVTATTKFWIASVTKQFTAAAILQRAESGRLRLDATIGDCLEEYPRKHAGRITIEQLFMHTSGIPDYADREFMAAAAAQTSTPTRLLKLFWERDLEFEPGSRFRYTNSGYIVLGAIVERLTGKSWAAAMEDRIFGPLGMRNTSFDDVTQMVTERAAGYHLTYEGPQNARHMDRSAAYAAGGLRSTVDDLYRWDRAIYQGQVVTDSWVNQMFRVRQANYACGWAVTYSKVEGLKTKPLRAWHGGGAPGFKALITRFPEEHFLIVLLSNTDNGPSLREMTDRIAAFLFGSAVENPKPQISKTI